MAVLTNRRTNLWRWPTRKAYALTLIMVLSGLIVSCGAKNRASIACYHTANRQLSVVMGVRRIDLSPQSQFKEDPSVQPHPHLMMKPGVKLGLCKLSNRDAEKVRQAGIPLR